MTRPLKISVVTAAYNAARFLPDCLASVARQMPGDFEIEHIVVDGQSGDGTQDVLRRHPGVRWISEPDEGQADAFNKGVAMSDADWICWLNADDLLAPGAALALTKAVGRRPGVGMVYGHVQFVRENLTPAWTCYHLPFWYPLVWHGCYTPPSSGTFFRRELLVSEPLDTHYHYVMDVEWFLRCGRGIHATRINKTLSQFRISDTAKTSAMIRFGKINERHAAERENYRRKHVYSHWPHLSEDQARRRFERSRKIFRLFYYALKMRHALQYAGKGGKI